jgi:hypothetical protein
MSSLASTSSSLASVASSLPSFVSSGLVSAVTSNPVMATAAATVVAATAANSAYNTVSDFRSQKTPTRPSDTATILLSAKNRKYAWIDNKSVKFCCEGNDFSRIKFEDLRIKSQYSQFMSTSDFIVLCELPVSSSKVGKNDLLLNDKIYSFNENVGDLVFKQLYRNAASWIVSGVKTLTYTHQDDTNVETVVKGISDVQRIADVLKSSIVNPALTVVINYDGIIGKKAPEDRIELIVFIKHLLRNMAVVYSNDERKNLHPEPINDSRHFSIEETFRIPPASNNQAETEPGKLLYIFQNKLLSFWKEVTQGDSKYYLHFQVLLKKANKVSKIDVQFHEDNSFETLMSVRKKWIYDTFKAKDATMTTQGIWDTLAKEGSSSSSSLTDYKEEFQKKGSELLEKATSIYKDAIENGNTEEVKRAKRELHKVKYNLLLDSLKSDGDSSLFRNMYSKLTDLGIKGDNLEGRRDMGLLEDSGRSIDYAPFGSPNAVFGSSSGSRSPFGFLPTKGNGGGGPVNPGTYSGKGKKSLKSKKMKRTLVKRKHKFNRRSKAKKKMIMVH